MHKNLNEMSFFEKLPNLVLIPVNGKKIRPYPICGKREIICGPNLQKNDTKERKFIPTSGTFFDVEEVLLQLDETDKKIDLVFSVLETSTTCFPKNLFKLKCPKIALIGDTHHKLYSISSVIRYIKREKFDYIFVSAQPAHLHFFYEAGFKHSAFFPPIVPKYEITMKYKKPGLTYIGKMWGSTHLRRSRMAHYILKNLPKKNIPINYYDRLPGPIWRKMLTTIKMIAVSSSNGQFTPQIIHCLFAGALCFVDELSSQTFLYNFFEPGKHLITWQNFEDLVKKIIYYHNHPEEAEIIAKAGKLQADTNFTISENRWHRIIDFVFENKIDPRYLAINDARCQEIRLENPEYYYARLRLYENIQELHRIHESLNLVSFTKNNLKPIADIADLPRLKITHVFTSDNLKNEAELFFKRVGVKYHINTIKFDKIRKYKSFNIGILEITENHSDWNIAVKGISYLLKSNSVLWVLGKLNSHQIQVLRREGFRSYSVNNNRITLKIKEISRKICFLLWKWHMYPLPYLTLKPAMKTELNLNVFLRGWQAYFPFLY